MAMTIDSLAKLLKKVLGADFPFHVNREHRRLLCMVPCDSYRDANGNNSVEMHLVLSPDGRYVEVQTSRLYNLQGCEHTYSVLRLLLGVCWRTNVVQFSVDESDGEIQASAEMILADNTLTPEQLRDVLGTLLLVVDSYHPHIEEAMQTGAVTFPDEPEVRSVLPSAGGDEPPGKAALDVDTEGTLRAMIQGARERAKSAWGEAKPAIDVIRHW
jgi:hypothetical protein